MTETFQNSDVEKLYENAADHVEKGIREMLEEQEQVVLAVAGGRSMPGIFKLFGKKEIDWKKVHIFIVDDRLVQMDHKESNSKLAKEGFVDGLIESRKLPAENFHPFQFNDKVDDYGVFAYEDELKKMGGKYDILLLSSGEDGHIGALYPDHHSVQQDRELFIWMKDSPKPPPERMSMSRKLVQKAEISIIMFVGEGKRVALRDFMDDCISATSMPAKLVQDNTECYVLTDQEL